MRIWNLHLSRIFGSEHQRKIFAMSSFLEEPFHWYDMTNDCVEFRAQDSPWTHSPDDWTLTKVGPGGHWRLKNNSHSLISIKSKTSKLVAKALDSLEDPLRVHCIFRESF